jgi:hypothetical protein
MMIFNLYNDILEDKRNGNDNRSRQKSKFQNRQFEFNRNLKDENAYYHHLAYNYRIEKEFQEKVNADLLMKKQATRSTIVDKNIKSAFDNAMGF